MLRQRYAQSNQKVWVAQILDDIAGLLRDSLAWLCTQRTIPFGTEGAPCTPRLRPSGLEASFRPSRTASRLGSAA